MYQLLFKVDEWNPSISLSLYYTLILFYIRYKQNVDDLWKCRILTLKKLVIQVDDLLPI